MLSTSLQYCYDTIGGSFGKPFIHLLSCLTVFQLTRPSMPANRTNREVNINLQITANEQS